MMENTKSVQPAAAQASGQQRRSTDPHEDLAYEEISPNQVMILRENLQKVLHSYTKETFSYIHTIRKFCEGISGWTAARKTEFKKIKGIKDQFEETQRSLKNLPSPRKHKQLRQELAAVLKGTLAGFEELDYFVGAVKKMAVTSAHVFMEEQQIKFYLPKGVSVKHVQDLITAARETCPLLLKINRDVISSFFLPKLRYLEVISDKLAEYTKTTKIICDKIKTNHLPREMSAEAAAALGVGFSVVKLKNMLNHMNKLVKIREDQHLWVWFLLQDGSEFEFITEFENRQPSLQWSVTELEEVAAQLDSMNKGAKIYSVIGSTVGVVGGALIIAGLALSPVTAGTSLILTATGVGLSITSGVNSVVTTATEAGVNKTQQNRAKNTLEYLQSIGKCHQNVKKQPFKIDTSQMDNAVRADRGVDKAVAVLKFGPLLGKGATAAATGAKAISMASRGVLIGLNAALIGLDIFFIYQDGTGLAGGSETDFSKWIRTIVKEVEMWQNIYDSLKSEEKRALLKRPFYAAS